MILRFARDDGVWQLRLISRQISRQRFYKIRLGSGTASYFRQVRYLTKRRCAETDPEGAVNQGMLRLAYGAYTRFGKTLKKVMPAPLREKFRRLLNGEFNKRSFASAKRGGKPLRLEYGVNLVGYIRGEFGLGHGCRLLAKAIDLTRIPWSAITYEKIRLFRYGDDTFTHKIVKRPQYNINIIHINPDSLHLAAAYLPKSVWRVPCNIGFLLWELSVVPEFWVSALDFFDEIWCPSDFTARSLGKKTTKPVLKIPYGVSLESVGKYDRGYFGLPENVFLFLTMYDRNSTQARKNPAAAAAAFKKAFSPADCNVGLIIKINNQPEGAKDETEELKASLSGYKHIYFIEKTLYRDETDSLIGCADCVVSLHRSEGFGLVIAEGMYAKKPVIVTNWSANTDFCDAQTSCPVKYSLIAIDKDTGPYETGNLWAKPDTDDAARYMRKLTTDKDYYTQIAENGHRYIKEHYSFEACAALIKKRLDEIRSH